MAEQLLRMYRQMALIRCLDDRLLELRSSGELAGAVHPCAGHEAIAVGMCGALAEPDVLVSYYRGMGHAIARGVDISRLLAERRGQPDGYCLGRAGEFLFCREVGLQFTAAIIGSGAPIAAGAALAAQAQRSDAVVAVFFGDGAMGAGIVHETMNIAATWRLPIVFVCENNLYQDHTRTEEVFPDVGLARLAAGHLIPHQTVDGNDVEAMLAAATAAVALARSGGGPSFIEAKTYLLRFHLQFDQPPPAYRPADEEAAWAARDPLKRARAALLSRGVAAETLAGVERAVAAETELAAQRVRAGLPRQPQPTPGPVAG